MGLPFKIKKVHAVFGWKWSIDQICGICQQNLGEMCSDCQHPIECKPCLGNCNHAYHLHCINQWTKTSSECPMCRMFWKVKEYFL
ncbi:anaphase-promoting complex subunit 11 [Tubulinosema ratisbonensis]|uniref:Anaphase-promoting complex subunit 11 n=1 Tax=Tubulinosema ratisbonensis TaxID=291195 RepID=A0A437AJM8_9MICR|nr:anaphase-promoting complex subunit 11 [Tubulinosema ratisbonensis]